MADIDLDQLGPVDYMVVGFPAEKADFLLGQLDLSGPPADQGEPRPWPCRPGPPATSARPWIVVDRKHRTIEPGILCPTKGRSPRSLVL